MILCPWAATQGFRSYGSGWWKEGNTARALHQTSALAASSEGSTMWKTWRERLFGSPTCPKRKHTFRPGLEELEGRVTPYSYTWTNSPLGGGGDGVWENQNNWVRADGTINGFPSSPSDSATFRPLFNVSCTMTQAETVGQIVTQGWTATLTLRAQLTLFGGSSSWMTGTIIQKTATTNGPIEVTPQTTFSWGGGDINPSGGASTFTVDRLGTFTVGALVNNKFGDDLNNSGQLNLTNSFGSSVTLVNRPTITNTSSGTIQITTDNPVGILVQSGDPVVTIQNQGLIVMEANIQGTYSIDDPVSDSGSMASIWVQSGASTLRFKGADPTTGYSVNNQSDGFIEIDQASTLQADNGVYLTGGYIEGLPGANIRGNLEMLGGTLQEGDGITPANLGSMNIWGNWDFRGGTLRVFIYGDNLLLPKYGSIDVQGGNVTVNGPATTITVANMGMSNPSTPLGDVLLILGGGSVSPFPGTTDLVPDHVTGNPNYSKAVIDSVGGGTNNGWNVI